MNTKPAKDSKKSSKDNGDGGSGVTLKMLVEDITSDTNIASALRFEVLLTYPSFCTSHQLLEAIVERYAEEDEIIKFRCLNFVKSWVDEFYEYILYDPALIAKIAQFCYRSQDELPNLEAIVSGILTKLKKTPKAVTSDLLTNVTPLHMFADQGVEAAPEKSILDFCAHDIAQQLTLIESQIFASINPWEFLNTSWTNNPSEQAPGINRCTRWFDHVSNWVQTEIVRESCPKRRSRLLNKFIEVLAVSSPFTSPGKYLEVRKKMGSDLKRSRWRGRSLCNPLRKLATLPSRVFQPSFWHMAKRGQILVEYQNFSSAIEIVSALQCTSVSRLKNLWITVPKQTKSVFDKAKSWGDVGNNLKKLRNHLETAPPPCLPYIGIFLHDMIYIDEVYPKQVNGKINWAKHHAQAKILMKIRSFRSNLHQYPVIEPLQEHIIYAPRYNNEVVCTLSNYLEPKKLPPPDVVRINPQDELTIDKVRPVPRPLMSREDRQKDRLSVVFMGLGNSGKSTMFKQFYNVMGAKIPAREAQRHREYIRESALASILTLMDQIEDLPSTSCSTPPSPLAPTNQVDGENAVRKSSLGSAPDCSRNDYAISPIVPDRSKRSKTPTRVRSSGGGVKRSLVKQFDEIIEKSTDSPAEPGVMLELEPHDLPSSDSPSHGSSEETIKKSFIEAHLAMKFSERLVTSSSDTTSSNDVISDETEKHAVPLTGEPEEITPTVTKHERTPETGLPWPHQIERGPLFEAASDSVVGEEQADSRENIKSVKDLIYKYNAVTETETDSDRLVVNKSGTRRFSAPASSSIIEHSTTPQASQFSDSSQTLQPSSSKTLQSLENDVSERAMKESTMIESSSEIVGSAEGESNRKQDREMENSSTYSEKFDVPTEIAEGLSAQLCKFHTECLERKTEVQMKFEQKLTDLVGEMKMELSVEITKLLQSQIQLNAVNESEQLQALLSDSFKRVADSIALDFVSFSSLPSPVTASSSPNTPTSGRRTLSRGRRQKDLAIPNEFKPDSEQERHQDQTEGGKPTQIPASRTRYHRVSPSPDPKHICRINLDDQGWHHSEPTTDSGSMISPSSPRFGAKSHVEKEEPKKDEKEREKDQKISYRRSVINFHYKEKEERLSSSKEESDYDTASLEGSTENPRRKASKKGTKRTRIPGASPVTPTKLKRSQNQSNDFFDSQQGEKSGFGVVAGLVARASSHPSPSKAEQNKKSGFMNSAPLITPRVKQEQEMLLQESDEKIVSFFRSASIEESASLVKRADELSDEVAGHFLRFWKTPEVQKVFKDNPELFSPAAEYYLRNIWRISQSSYEPSIEDVLRTYFPSTGVSDLKGHWENQSFLVEDVGGRPSEMKKWPIVIKKQPHVIAFFVSLDDYDQVEGNQNKLKTALSVWGEATNRKEHHHLSSSWLLVLNKLDLFLEKLKSVPFTAFEPSVPTSYAQNPDFCISYIIDLFRGKFGDVYVLPVVTSAIDDSMATDFLQLLLNANF